MFPTMRRFNLKVLRFMFNGNAVKLQRNFKISKLYHISLTWIYKKSLVCSINIRHNGFSANFNYLNICKPLRYFVDRVQIKTIENLKQISTFVCL